MTRPQDDRWPTSWFVLVVTSGIFVFDILTPLGVAVPILYVVPLVLTWAIAGDRISVLVGGGAVFLTVLGIVLSPGEINEVVVGERLMASTVHALVTWTLILQKRSARKIKVAQQARDESEARLRLFIEHAPVALAMFDRNMRYLSVSRRWITDYGLNGRELIGRSHYDIFPDLPERWKAVHRRGLAGAIVRQDEERFERPDGVGRWICWEVRPWTVEGGTVGGIVIFTEDITDRKKVELELREHQAQLEHLTASLLTAQEEERKRIARDLHDDFTQQLAAMTIDLQRQAVLDGESKVPRASLLAQIGKRAEQLTTDLQRMSHQLHSSLLEHVGLEAAFRECTEEFSSRTGLTTEVVMHEMPRGISIGQATCLYRVLQEGLQNVTKHAKATNVLIRVLRADNGVELRIQDDGIGFDHSGEAAHPKGLGLTSMAERVKSHQGTFRVVSTAGLGTEIHAWVPNSERPSDR